MISYILLGILIFAIGLGFLKRLLYSFRLNVTASMVIFALIIILNIFPPLKLGNVYIYYGGLLTILTAIYMWFATKKFKLIVMDFIGILILTSCLIVYESFVPVTDFHYLHNLFFILICGFGGYLFSTSTRGAVLTCILAGFAGATYYYFAIHSNIYVIGGGNQFEIVILSAFLAGAIGEIVRYFALRKVKSNKVSQFESGTLYEKDEYEKKMENKKTNGKHKAGRKKNKF